MSAKKRWENRIVGYGEEAPEQLLANPQNFRIHPKAQQDALSGALAEVGIIAPVIVNKLSGHVVDGHLRVSLAISRSEPTIPVAYVELDEAAERLALATFDPLGAMAGADREQLAELLEEVRTDDAALRQALQDLAVTSQVAPPDVEFKEYDEHAADDVEFLECPSCGHRWPK